MLPKSRIFSALLLGLGIALMVGGLAAPVLLNADGRLPLDLRNTTWTITDEEAVHAPVYDPEAEPVEGPVTHQLHLQIQPPATEENTTVRIGSSWFAGTGDNPAELISAQTWSYVLDRLSGEAQTPATLTHTIGMPTAEVAVDGQWLKFPSDAEQTTYDVFDETLRSAHPAVFIDSLGLGGREVYHYRQEIEPTNVAQAYAGMFNTRVIPTEGGGTEQAYLFHSATRDIYVDQITGVVVDMEVAVDDFYGRADGSRVDDVLTFAGSMAPEQTQALVEELDSVVALGQAQLWRWIIVGIGAAVAVLGLLGAFAGRDRGRGRGRREASAADRESA